NQEFFQNLREKYSDLSDNEIRLAGLLRLDFSSKDIASLLSIASKSVDMSRYRLRKKFSLESNDSLTDFLQAV
ncbi:MAG: hypothetical protein IH946_04455, partial [Bacteroidetes bacterium]|nr:hypothetical protein [Bacteroidota bacterium]